MKEISFLKSVIICAVLFVLSATLSAFVGNMIITDTAYFAVSADSSDMDLWTLTEALRSASEVSLFQLFVLLFSGFSVLSVFASSLVSVIRGITFGYSAVTVASGVAFAEKSLPVGICYALTSVVVILFSALSVSFSLSIRENGLSVSAVSKYLAVFLSFSGVVVLFDSARLLFV